MIPKDKAKELIERFTFNCRECDFEENAKICALIAVDEILNLDIYQSEQYYWEEVKQEIEKL